MLVGRSFSLAKTTATKARALIFLQSSGNAVVVASVDNGFFVYREE
jgi:hypothetical protein